MDDLLLLLIISKVDHNKLSVVQSESLVYQKRVVHVDCLINRLDHACTFWAVSRLLEPVEHFLWKFPLFLLFVFVDPSSDRWLITGEQDGAGDQLEVNKCRGLSILQICFQSCPTDRQFSFLLDWGTFRSVLWSDVRNIVKYYCEYFFFLHRLLILLPILSLNPVSCKLAQTSFFCYRHTEFKRRWGWCICICRRGSLL